MFNLQQAYDAIKDRREFVAKETAETVCFDYVITTPDSFIPSQEETQSLGQHGAMQAAWLRRNFRGMTFLRATGELVSLPLHKFFNVNQNEESRFELHKHKKAAIYEKLDGSMIHFYRIGERLVASTCRSAESDQARAAAALARELGLEPRIGDSVDAGMTPVFEYVAPTNQIVVRYEKPRLVYLISRSRQDGTYVFENGYEDCAKRQHFVFSDVMQMLDGEGFEGYICHLEDGNILKVKTPWYLERHRCVDMFMKPAYFVYETALNGTIDDLVASSPDSYKQKLLSVWREVDEDFLNMKFSVETANREIIEAVRSSHGPDPERKLLVEEVRRSDPDRFTEHMVLLNGKSVDQVVKKKLLETYRLKYAERFYST